MRTITLDIEKISDELYDLLLKEIKEQNPDVSSSIIEWSFTAKVEE